MKKTKPILYDPLIINRVKQYLEENVHQTYLDVGVMSKALQERYPEYSRRKIAPFRSLVEQAYKVVSQSYGLDISPPSPDSGSDLEVMDDTPATAAANSMNNMLTNLYSKKSSKATEPGKAQEEPIDILSSDEGSDDENTANGKSKESQPEAVVKFGEVTLRKIIAPDGKSTPSDQGPVKRSATPTLSRKRKRGRSKSPLKGDDAQTNKLKITPNPESKSVSSDSDENEGPGIDGRTFVPMVRTRKYNKEVHPMKARHNFQDVGGMDHILKELCEILIHVKHPDIYYMLGLMPPRGLLLHGPSGCGKTLLAHAIAGQLNIGIIEVAATELIAGVSGESEERIRDLFEQAVAVAPCVLFIDEIDAISSNRSNAQRDMERRIVSQLISSLDGLKATDLGRSVLVLGATTRPDVLDPALRRIGRFDHEIAIGIPGRKERKEILQMVCDGLSVHSKMDYDKIAELTPGYVGADMLALVSRAATIAVKRKCTQQMKEMQEKSQRNITIVDLIDEGQAEGVDAASNKKDSSPAKDDGKEGEKSKTASPAANVETTSKDSDSQPAKEAEQESAPSTTTPTKKKDGKSPKKPEAQEEPEKMDVEESDSTVLEDSSKNSEETKTVVNEEPIDVDELPEVIEPSASETPTKPLSLFEMLNMLDNVVIDSQDIVDFCITLEDFKQAVKLVQPSAKREGFITVPDVTWDDVGSLKDIREELKLAVLAPVKFPEKLDKLGLTAPSGILLCGPPGCGKTLLAKAIANEAGINFISVKGPEMMNMYVGESERAVRACFQRARNSAPCVIFFDEFDSLCPKRSDNNDSGSGTRIVNQLLTEMDGVEGRKGVYILAATNRPDIIDPAILRPGRLDTILYVGLPNAKDREEILLALTKNRKKPILAEDVNLKDLAIKTEGYTGADLAGLVRQASMLALKESVNNPDPELDDLCVNAAHFKKAVTLLRPSVNIQDRKMYEKLKEKYAAPRLPDDTK